MPYKTSHPWIPRNIATNGGSGEAVLVLPYKGDGKEGNTRIVEAVPCEDGKIVYAVQCEEGESAKK